MPEDPSKIIRPSDSRTDPDFDPDADPGADPHTDPDADPGAEDIAAQLEALGAETDTERAVKRILPWVVSLGIHVAMVILGFLVTWTVVMLQRDEEPVLIVADFNATNYEPLARLNVEKQLLTQELVQDRVETDTTEDRLEDRPELEIDPIELMSGAPADSALARFTPDETEGSASFVGLTSTNARRIVYVIDASGSMIPWLPFVVEELARSLDGLASSQEFKVIFFSRNEAIVVPPPNRMSSGTEAAKQRVLSWIDENVIPAGLSNPLPAIDRALGFEPDAIFLLSSNITGSGEYEIDKADLLRLLDQLNPVQADGHRATQINCVQFLDPDERLQTLREIAARHGGPKGYKFLDREELGLQSP